MLSFLVFLLSTSWLDVSVSVKTSPEECDSSEDSSALNQLLVQGLVADANDVSSAQAADETAVVEETENSRTRADESGWLASEKSSSGWPRRRRSRKDLAKILTNFRNFKEALLDGDQNVFFQDICTKELGPKFNLKLRKNVEVSCGDTALCFLYLVSSKKRLSKKFWYDCPTDNNFYGDKMSKFKDASWKKLKGLKSALLTRDKADKLPRVFMTVIEWGKTNEGTYGPHQNHVFTIVKFDNDNFSVIQAYIEEYRLRDWLESENDFSAIHGFDKETMIRFLKHLNKFLSNGFSGLGFDSQNHAATFLAHERSWNNWGYWPTLSYIEVQDKDLRDDKAMKALAKGTCIVN